METRLRQSMTHDLPLHLFRAPLLAVTHCRSQGKHEKSDGNQSPQSQNPSIGGDQGLPNG